LYAAPALKPKVDRLVAQTKIWMENEHPVSQQELTFQLLGLHWCAGGDEIKKEVTRKMLDLQRTDGGWAQLPSLGSDAYATGETLFALLESGMIQAGDEKCQKAIQYLLKSQHPDGAWYVEARSYIIQPFMSTDFPVNDENQFISAAATSWASMALLKTLPDKMN